MNGLIALTLIVFAGGMAHGETQETAPLNQNHATAQTLHAVFVDLSQMGACPTSLEQWKEWRRGKFMELLSRDEFNFAKVVDGDIQIRRHSVKGYLKRCEEGQKDIQSLPEFQACFSRILELERIAMEFTDGFEKPSKGAVLVAGFPSTYSEENMVRLASQVGTKVPGSEKKGLLAAVKALTAGSEKSSAVRFPSGIIAGLNSFVLFDLRPGGKQFWTHMTLRPEDVTDFLSVEVDPDQNSNTGVSHFQLHTIRKGEGMRSKIIEPVACLQCHRTAAISLVSKDPSQINVIQSLGKKDGASEFAALNQFIEKGALALPKGVSQESLGPARGPMIHRSIDYLRRLAGHELADDQTLLRLAPQMGCVQCHDSKTSAGVISTQLALPMIFENYVTSAHMPQKTKLSKPDLQLLSHLISAEYQGGYTTSDGMGKEPGILGAWLNEPCPWTK